MKTKLILAILLLAGCKKEETPTPQPETPVVVYYIELTPEDEFKNHPLPIVKYTTDSTYSLSQGRAWPVVKKWAVKRFADSIEIEVPGTIYGDMTVSFIRGDSVLTSDIFNKDNQKTKRLKWPS